MPRLPQVLVRDRETGHEYEVTEARYKRTPDLWDRIEAVPAKPKTTVSAEAAKKRAARKRAAKKATSTRATKKAASGHQADPNQEEN